MNPNISILAEIPEELHKSLKEYLDAHPAWDQDQVFAVALSLFFLQNMPKKPVRLFPIAPAVLPILHQTDSLSYICSRDRN